MMYTIENARAYGELSDAVYENDGGTPQGWENVLLMSELLQGTVRFGREINRMV